jgi:hypothetical protein
MPCPPTPGARHAPSLDDAAVAAVPVPVAAVCDAGGVDDAVGPDSLPVGESSPAQAGTITAQAATATKLHARRVIVYATMPGSR